MEIRHYNMDAAALSATRLAYLGKPREVAAGYTFYWVGHPADSRREHGVCFAVSDRVSSLLIGEPVGLSPRIMPVRMRLGGGKFASLISVYRFTVDHPEEEENQFYSQLSLLIKVTPTRDRFFLMGDYNDRVGWESNIWPDVIDAHGIGKFNENGERPLTLCAY